MSELAAALVEFQSKVPPIAKNRTAKIPTKNGNSYSYRFADLSDIWDAIRTPLKECGLAVTQSLVGGSSGYTGIRTTLWHKGGEKESDVLEIQTQGKTAQEAGSQYTYFKRYALTALLGISTEEDDDGQAGNARPVSKALEDARKRIAAAAARAGVTPGECDEMYRKRFGRTILESVDAHSLNGLADHLTEKAVQKEMA